MHSCLCVGNVGLISVNFESIERERERERERESRLVSHLRCDFRQTFVASCLYVRQAICNGLMYRSKSDDT
jgi:hypothetical protein